MDNFVSTWTVAFGALAGAVGCLIFKEAACTGGTHQPMYTAKCTNFDLIGGLQLTNALAIHNCDGISFASGHISGGSSACVMLKNLRESQLVGNVLFSNVYFDSVSVSSVTGASYVVDIPSDGFSATIISGIRFNNCILGNTKDIGVRVANTKVYGLNFIDCSLINMLKSAIDFVGAATVSELSVTACKFDNIAVGGAVSCINLSGGGGAFSILGNQFNNIGTGCINVGTATFTRGMIANNVARNHPAFLANTGTSTVALVNVNNAT